jgi:hypothetical protein
MNPDLPVLTIKRTPIIAENLRVALGCLYVFGVLMVYLSCILHNGLKNQEESLIVTAPVRRIILILAVIELALTLLFLYGYYRWAIEWRLNGTRTQAEIIEKRQDGEEYYVTYVFEADGKTYCREHRVVQSFYENTDFGVGDSVEIIYSPIDTNANGIPGQGTGDFQLKRLPGTFFNLTFLAFILPAIILTGLLVLLGFLLYGRRRKISEVQLS